MKKRLLSLILALAVVVALAGCKETQPVTTDAALVLSSQEVDTVFNPFFASSGPDSTVVGYTQIGMLGNDKNGKVTYGNDEPVVVLDYETVVNGSEGDDDYTTTYKFVLKNNIKFSNGSPLTIKDVLFNLYVYLDPVYYGSSTIYSTDIVGLQEYRTQEVDEEAQDRFMEQFQIAAQTRIEYLGTAANEIIDEADGASLTMDEFKVALEEKTEIYGEEILVDFAKACELFEEELETDYKNSVGGYESVSFKDANGVVKKGLLTTDVESFLYNEGYITFNRKESKLESSLTNNPSELKGWTKEKAIKTILEDKLPMKIEEIIYYWATATELYDYLVNEAMSDYNNDPANADRPFKNISGIKFANRTSAITVNGKEYGIPTYKNDGSVASGNEVLTITIIEVDPKAIWNFAFSVAPMYYYSNAEQISLFDYEANFGVQYSSQDFMNNVVNADDKNGVPVGAGAYQVADSAGNTEGVTEGSFYNSNVMYFVSNKHFLMGEPKIKKINLKVIPSNRLIDSLMNKETDFIQPNSKPEIISDLDKQKANGISHQSIETSGYGYIGVNAGKVPDLGVRQAIMHSIDTSMTVDYYGNTASAIHRSMSLASWAYPKGATPYYPFVGGKIPEDLSVVNPAYEEFVTDKGYDAGDIMSKEDQQEFLISLVEDAGYEMGGSGIYVKGSHTLKYTFTVAGNEKDHPAYNPFLQAAEILNAIGFEINVTPDSNALQKLTNGELAVWAAAWSSTIDPDMYQVYHKDSKATSTKNWGYKQILQNTNNKYAVEIGLVEVLSEKIELARKTNDQDVRAAYYSEALDIVMQLAVELPTYQRDDLFAYNTNKIDESSLTPKSELSPYSGLMNEIWNVRLNTEN